MTSRKLLILFLTSICADSASASNSDAAQDIGKAPTSAAVSITVNELAVAYVKLVLALGQIDDGYVDAYYGPSAWKDEARQQSKSLAQIQVETESLLSSADSATTDPVEDRPSLREQRLRYLKAQLSALDARARLLAGNRLAFDDEAKALYDVKPPRYSEADFDPILRNLDALVPKGPGTLSQRYNRFVEKFAVPKDKLEIVMRTAIDEARRRSLSNMPLPLGERFELSFVSGKPWGAYNWYQGNLVSRIEVNTDLPIPVSRVIELASHEGYPGHHVYNSMLEMGLVRDRGWPEYQVYALFSPQSLLAEGTADFGVGLAFPGEEKLAFTRELFKLAGFDPRKAASYLKIVTAARALAPAGIEAARRRLDGTASEEETSTWLQKYTLASPDKARHAIAFMDHYRSYVINYSYGETLVRGYVESHGDKQLGSSAQWQAFLSLVSQPHVPADLVAPTADVDSVKGEGADMSAFDSFIATRPTPEQFHSRYPDVKLVLSGEITTKEFRMNHSRYFATQDDSGRIVGGRFK